MLKAFLFIYTPRFSRTIIYMLQAVEYKIRAYLKWGWHTQDFRKVNYRKDLILTRPSKMLLKAFLLGEYLQMLLGVGLGGWAIYNHSTIFTAIALALFLGAPIIWSHLIIVPLVLGDWFVIKPLYGKEIKKSVGTFKKHPAVKIAIAGSYGKTSMKEILLTVLGEGKKVAATPANKNVSISHARFAQKLNGDEDILVIEYGEGAPGDVAKFAKRTDPTIGVITGLAPAHLDQYKTLENAGKDIFSLADYLKGQKVYVNTEAEAVKPFIKDSYIKFNSDEAAGWKISGIKQSIDGLIFTMKKGKDELRLKSRLLGEHQVAPLALAAALAHNFGLTTKQIQDGVAKVPAFEHRMSPYQLAGAWIIDDTYNGNIEGMKAGLQLLKALPAKRKIYVTPGLVDQGAKSPAIHQKLGQSIAAAQPDITVLIKHSVTEDITKGLEENGYKGELIIEDDPLNFYTNLDKFVAAGDIALMQNDWPDNYN
jgi:UDP-N-acetylmuramoyl-tripeptide--D-alanyl-D-alanine ligase